MKAKEIPLVFDCHGDALVGIVHAPELPARTGVLMIVAGGPQYRAGCCRQLLLIARAMAARGYAVMRFDYRGLGDSAGPFRGFQSIHDDLTAALTTFMREVPSLTDIVLWGGCDAASASMIHGWRLPLVKGMILGNPFASSEATRARAIVKSYYLDRLRDRAFWARVVRFRFNPLSAANDLLGTLRRSLDEPRYKTNAAADADPLGNGPFPVRMREGFKRFGGPALLIMSGKSLVRQEFDSIVAASPEWRSALHAKGVSRHDIPHADQAFSTIAARQEALAAALAWLEKTGFPVASVPKEAAALAAVS